MRTLIDQATEIAPALEAADLDASDEYGRAAAQLDAWLTDWHYGQI